MLGDLQESFNSLEEGSKSMVAQVRAAALVDVVAPFLTFLDFLGKEAGCSADCKGVVLVPVKAYSNEQ